MGGESRPTVGAEPTPSGSGSSDADDAASRQQPGANEERARSPPEKSGRRAGERFDQEPLSDRVRPFELPRFGRAEELEGLEALRARIPEHEIDKQFPGREARIRCGKATFQEVIAAPVLESELERHSLPIQPEVCETQPAAARRPPGDLGVVPSCVLVGADRGPSRVLPAGALDAKAFLEEFIETRRAIFDLEGQAASLLQATPPPPQLRRCLLPKMPR